MNNSFYQELNYKKILKLQIKEKQKTTKSFSLKKVAEMIPVQYTYLSKVLNQEGADLNEDHLFSVCRILGFRHEETEFIINLRAWSLAQDLDRKKFLYGKLETQRKQKKLNAEHESIDQAKLNNEYGYLLNPLCVVVHIAMTSQILRKNPSILCTRLGLSQKQLKEILKTLAINDLIDLSVDGLNVKAVKKMQLHLGRNHPLMRVHQNLLKTAILNRLNQTGEEEKHSFMATFTLDAKSFSEIKDEFQTFVKKVEGIATRSQRPVDHRPGPLERG